MNVARLFTISTPHRGAKLAWVPSIDARVIDMRPDASFVAHLNEQETTYELFPYTRLDDAIVGEENAAPPGQNAWWVPNIPGGFSHLLASSDPRFLADIMRRLRGEAPFTRLPRHPLPLRVATARGQDSLAK